VRKEKDKEIRKEKKEITPSRDEVVTDYNRDDINPAHHPSSVVEKNSVYKVAATQPSLCQWIRHANSSSTQWILTAHAGQV